jgi:hypothetical protein
MKSVVCCNAGMMVCCFDGILLLYNAGMVEYIFDAMLL